MDGQSIGVLIQDLQLAYDGRLDSRSPSYSSFLQHVAENSQEEGREYWMKYMDGIEPCILRASAQTASIAKDTFRIDVACLDATQINHFCRKLEVTTANVLQVAWAAVLAYWTGSQAPCFGNILSTRDAPVHEINDMIGPLMCLIPIRVRLGEELSLSDAVRCAHAEFVQSLKYQAYPVMGLWRDLRARSSDKIFNTALSIAGEGGGLTATRDGHTFGVRDDFDPVEVCYPAPGL